MADNDYYVYRLVDPRDEKTFYVGKGKGERVFAHVHDALKNYKGVDYSCVDSNGLLEDEVSAKTALIREIHKQGLEVQHIIHRGNLDEKTAYEVEAALIDAYPGLTNSVRGHGAVSSYSPGAAAPSSPAPPGTIASFPDKCIIIKIRHDTVLERGSVYEAVRGVWRASLHRARQCDYVLAVERGTVTGVFKPSEWYRATPENARKYGGFSLEGRIAFVGEPAEIEAQNLYLNKRLPDEYLPAQNPVQFTYQSLKTRGM